VAIALGNADPIMVPPGGGRAVLGSNPVALAVPPVAGAAPLLDMATTAAAHGKIVMAEARGAPIPSGWAVDAAGQETTVAAQALAGALLPAAGPKGFGLSFFVDVLCAGLAGGRTGSAIVPLYESPGQPQGATFVVIAIDPDHAAGAGELGRATSEVAAAVRAAGPDGSRPPMIPGEPERRREVEAGNELRVPREVVEQLDAVRPDVPLPRPPC
jgi:LDH2 family malate/lactate/ureidoglycolate dehydrogenase